MIKQEPSLNGRPIDIQVWKSDGSDGEFPGLHWEEVRNIQTPVNGFLFAKANGRTDLMIV